MAPRAPQQPADMLASERLMVGMRWLIAAWAIFQVTVDQDFYPARVRGWAYALVGVLVVGNLAFYVASRTRRRPRIGRLAAGSLAFDVLLAMSFIWLYSFDPDRSVWALTFIVVVEGAARFQMRGVLWSFAGVATTYVACMLWASSTYGSPVQFSSITFRMGLVLLVGLLAGRLAGQLEQQKSELVTALSEVERVDAWRSRLVQMLAHDLRGPLGTIESMVSLLRLRGERLDAPTTQRLLDAVGRQAARVQHLALDLLDLARIENASLKLVPEPFDLRILAVDAAKLVATDAEDVSFEGDEPVAVVADAQRIEQVYVNLLTNALRHGRPPFCVSISARDGMAELAVSDHGDGVPHDREPELFRAFSGSATEGSVGLGLWIARMLIEAHGGTLEYLRDGDQTTFRARFPTTQPALVAEGAPLVREARM